jgi:hypothetical protein
VERKRQIEGPLDKPGLGVVHLAGEELLHVGQHVRARRPGSRKSTACRRPPRRWWRPPRAFAGEEVGGERLHHRPLVGAGVLRLVDQNMLDPASSL